MDKLQWFKFTPSDWMMGKVQKCSAETRGMFMNLCCLYWNKECDLSAEDAEIEVDEDHFKTLLKKKIILLDGENICISFLDEQFEEILEMSDKRREAANKRWAKKNAKGMQDNASALQNDADKSKRREEREKNNVFSFDQFWKIYPKKVAKQKCLDKWLKLKDKDIESIKDSINNFIGYKPFQDYTHPNPLTYLNQKRWEDELPAGEIPKEFETMEQKLERLKKERGWT